MIGYPLDSHVVFNNGIPEYDRAISSAPLRELIKRLFSDGVLPDVATNLQVQYVGTTRVTGEVEGDTSTYNVVVNPGFGICAGCMKLQETYYGLAMDVSNTSNPRIDTLVLRLNDNDSVRTCDFHIVQGTPSSVPVAPALTRNSSVWEIGLANLFKPTIVSAQNPVVVTDTRLDPSRCGVISSISEFDTSELFRQIEDAIVGYEDEFNIWFHNLQTQLSGDVAGNLQNQIDNLHDDVDRAVAVADNVLTSNTTMFVSTSGNDTTGDGTYEMPFRTITKALSTIPKNLNGFECVINVAPGTYAETVEIKDYTGGTVVINSDPGSVVNVSGLDVRNCNVLIDRIHLAVGNVGIYVGSATLYCATGTIAVTGAAEAVTLRYGAVLEVTTTLTINNAASRALQVQYASTASVTTLAGTGNAIGIYAYHSTVFVRNQTISATVQTINENSVINTGGAVG